MSLYAPPDRDPAETLADPLIGLADLRKGLCSILLGYAVSVGTVLAVVGLLFYVIWQVRTTPSRQAVENASTALFVGGGVLFLSGLFSLSLIVRGKWLCLMRAPEHCNARWLMFASMMCLLAGPVLNFGSYLIGDAKAPAIRRPKNEAAHEATFRHLSDYKENITALDTRGWVKLVGDVAALLSSVFFVLFLRAVALCWDDGFRARLAEGYLLVTGLLAAGVVHLLLYPAKWMARPELVLGLAGGALLCVLWYFVLIISAIAGISSYLPARR